MKILPILLLLFATVLHSQPFQTVDDYEAAYPGLDFALHSAFIKCYVNRWQGTETSEIKGSQSKVVMICNGFWNKFVKSSETGNDTFPLTFEVLESSGATRYIPFSIWNEYLSDTLSISADNPFRKSK